MAAIHEALQALGPTAFADVPTSDAELTTYLQHAFDDALLLVDSVPPPPPPPEAPLQSSSARPRSTSAVSLSSARSAPAAPDREALQSAWGKPVKLSAKENPLGVSVYKLAGQDGKGAWFARRSVHEGLGFEAWREGLRKELPMGWTDEEAEDMVRSIQGQRELEKKSIEGVGDLAVYYLSAQFPGPSARRDFVTLLLTATGAIEKGGPRHFIVLSKPCEHEAEPPRNGAVRAQYESVEFVREVRREASEPRKAASALDLPSTGREEKDSLEKVKTTPAGGGPDSAEEKQKSRGRAVSFAEPLKGHARESAVAGSPAIEWVHVTRSDPGGNVPRFMVERGTPGGICSDAAKFVEWISKRNVRPDDESTQPNTEGASANAEGASGASLDLPRNETLDRPTTPSKQTLGSYLQAAASTATTAFEAYAPSSLTQRLHSSQDLSASSHRPSTPSSVSSSGSFASADEELALSPTPSAKSTAATPEDRATAQLAKKRAQLDAQLEKAQAQDVKDREYNAEKEADRRRKAQEKHARDVAKAEAAHAKALKDAQAKREKDARKEEQRREKALRKEEQAREKREKEDVKKQLELVTKERDVLRKENEQLTTDKERLEQDNKELRAAQEAGQEQKSLAEKA